MAADEFQVLPVRLGGMSLTQLRQALQQADIHTNAHAETLLTKLHLFGEEPAYLVRVGIVTVGQLGLTRGGTLPQIGRAALHVGFKLGPLALAPFMRLQWQAQPASTDSAMQRQRAPQAAVTVAVAHPGGAPSAPRGFYLRNVNGHLWLRGYVASDDYVWAASDQFAFELQ